MYHWRTSRFLIRNAESSEREVVSKLNQGWIDLAEGVVKSQGCINQAVGPRYHWTLLLETIEISGLQTPVYMLQRIL